ncbi:MAG TPA: hypothetical protein VGV15_22360 [Terriglobales bacterium]|nr:hypothetical protein [Terriglobales bacterium]
MKVADKNDVGPALRGVELQAANNCVNAVTTAISVIERSVLFIESTWTVKSGLQKLPPQGNSVREVIARGACAYVHR